jgi:hypothetical protein
VSTLSTTTTYWCEYNEDFEDDSLWKVIDTEDGGETISIVSEALRVDIPDDPSDIKALYQYKLPTSDYDIMCDLLNYTPDSETNGFAIRLSNNDVGVDNYRVHIQYSIVSGQKKVSTQYLIDGEPEGSAADNVDTIPTKLRIKKTGTVFYLYYYYDGGWNLLGSKDYGADHSQIEWLIIEALDVSGRGGSVDIDNLIFNSGSPAAYPKAWTTTSSTTTTTSSTTTCTTTSTPPP